MTQIKLPPTNPGGFTISAAFKWLFNHESEKDYDSSDPIIRVLKSLESYGRIAAGGLQVTAGKGMCATVLLCTIGAPLTAQGVGNIGGGKSDYLDILGLETDLNITGTFYETISLGNGDTIFMAVDVATGFAGLAAGLRQVPVVIKHESLPLTSYTTMPAFKVQGTTIPALLNDVGQIGLSLQNMDDL